MLSILPTRKASLPCFLLPKIWIRHIRLICPFVWQVVIQSVCSCPYCFASEKLDTQFCFGMYKCGKCINWSKEKMTSGTMAVRYGSGPDAVKCTAPSDINFSGSGTLGFTLYSSNHEWLPIRCSTVYHNYRSNLSLKGSDQRKNRWVWSNVNTRYLVWRCGDGRFFAL